MSVKGCIAVALVTAFGLLPPLHIANAAGREASCEAKPIAAARKAAQARRDAGDPAGAWTLLEPFVTLGCLADAPQAPREAKRKALSDYAWLLNDAYVDGADKRFGRGAPASEACIDLLSPLADDDLVPHQWMSPALRQATIANVKACATNCGPSLTCVPFRSNVWSAYLSEAKHFRARACANGAGQRLEDGRCIELRGKAGVGFVWSDHIKTDLPTAADQRAFCPALFLDRGGTAAVRLDVPETSALRDGSFCCAPFEVTVRPGTHEFMVSADTRDCNGGTGHKIIEEIYRLPAASVTPSLVRDNSIGLH